MNVQKELSIFRNRPNRPLWPTFRKALLHRQMVYNDEIGLNDIQGDTRLDEVFFSHASVKGSSGINKKSSGVMTECTRVGLPDPIVFDRLFAIPRMVVANCSVSWQADDGFGFRKKNERGEKELYAFPIFQFEICRSVYNMESHRKTKLYFIGWIGGYQQGSIIHFCPQWPHVHRFDPTSVMAVAFQIYYEFTVAVYNKRKVDRDVMKFLAENKEWLKY